MKLLMIALVAIFCTSFQTHKPTPQAKKKNTDTTGSYLMQIISKRQVHYDTRKIMFASSYTMTPRDTIICMFKARYLKDTTLYLEFPAVCYAYDIGTIIETSRPPIKEQ